MKYRNYHENRLALGDMLALDRTKLANERTFLSYLRAAIMVGVSSVSILKLFPDDRTLTTFAWTILPFSIGLVLVGGVRCLRLGRLLQQLDREADQVRAKDDRK